MGNGVFIQKAKLNCLKKVLIISYYWPPAGGPGVQRWLKFCTYLPQYGIEPIVYIPENPSYPIIDHHIKNEVPEGIQILKQPIFEPYNLASKLGGKSPTEISSGVIPPEASQTRKQKMLLWIRGNFFIPDARKNWVKPSISFLTKKIEEHAIDTIITTGPPHSLHLIGLGLKRKLNVNWIADFRDPWTSIGYHKKMRLTKTAANKHIELENEVLNTADKIIVTSKGTQLEFAQKTTQPIHIITNGFEPSIKEKNTVLDQKFSLAHIGSLLSARNPLILWEALSELLTENDQFAASFELKFAGVVSATVMQSITSYGLKKYVTNLGYISHKKAVELQHQSQVLLLIEIDSSETQMIIPGKLFEYIQSRRPILSLGPLKADFSAIISETCTGTFFTYTEKELLKNQICVYFELYLKNNLSVSPQGIEKYTRKNLTAQLAQLLNN